MPRRPPSIPPPRRRRIIRNDTANVDGFWAGRCGTISPDERDIPNGDDVRAVAGPRRLSDRVPRLGIHLPGDPFRGGNDVAVAALRLPISSRGPDQPGVVPRPLLDHRPDATT